MKEPLPPLADKLIAPSESPLHEISPTFDPPSLIRLIDIGIVFKLTV